MAIDKAMFVDRARNLYLRNDSTTPLRVQRKRINSLEKCNPGFLARLGAGRSKSQDKQYATAWSLSANDLSTHAHLMHDDWVSDDTWRALMDDIVEDVFALLGRHQVCMCVLRAALADHLAFTMVGELDPEEQPDGSKCCCLPAGTTS